MIQSADAILIDSSELDADAVVDAKSLASLRMPNRDGFMTDDRPDTTARRCMSDCAPIRRP